MPVTGKRWHVLARTNCHLLQEKKAPENTSKSQVAPVKPASPAHNCLIGQLWKLGFDGNGANLRRSHVFHTSSCLINSSFTITDGSKFTRFEWRGVLDVKLLCVGDPSRSRTEGIFTFPPPVISPNVESIIFLVSRDI